MSVQHLYSIFKTGPLQKVGDITKHAQAEPHLYSVHLFTITIILYHNRGLHVLTNNLNAELMVNVSQHKY